MKGPALSKGDRFKLFNKAVAGRTSLAITPAAGDGLAWGNNLVLGGSIAKAPAVSQVPTNTNFSVSGHILNLSPPTDHLGWRLQVLSHGRRHGVKTP